MNVDEFSKTIINFLRKLLILKISKDLIDEVAVSETKETKDKLIELSLKFQEMELKLLLDLFLIAESKRRFSSIPQLPFELALVDYGYRKSVEAK